MVIHMDDEKHREQIYRTFLGLLEDFSRNDLIRIDQGIAKIEKTIKEQSGWVRTPDGYTLRKQVNDKELRYKVFRTENGYVARNDNKPGSVHLQDRIDVERMFVLKYQDLLSQLHALLTEKETIMKGNYFIKDDQSRDLAIRIAKSLGYKTFDDEVEKGLK